MAKLMYVWDILVYALEKYTLQFEKCNHILALSQLNKSKENTR